MQHAGLQKTAIFSSKRLNLFLALLLPAIAGQLAAGEDQRSVDYAVIIDVYSGAVGDQMISEKEFWSGLESSKKGEEPDGAWLPKVIHIGHALSERDFDIGEQAEANGQKIVVQGHVSRQADGIG